MAKYWFYPLHTHTNLRRSTTISYLRFLHASESVARALQFVYNSRQSPLPVIDRKRTVTIRLRNLDILSIRYNSIYSFFWPKFSL